MASLVASLHTNTSVTFVESHIADFSSVIVDQASEGAPDGAEVGSSVELNFKPATSVDVLDSVETGQR